MTSVCEIGPQKALLPTGLEVSCVVSDNISINGVTIIQICLRAAIADPLADVYKSNFSLPGNCDRSQKNNAYDDWFVFVPNDCFELDLGKVFFLQYGGWHAQASGLFI